MRSRGGRKGQASHGEEAHNDGKDPCERTSDSNDPDYANDDEEEEDAKRLAPPRRGRNAAAPAAVVVVLLVLLLLACGVLTVGEVSWIAVAAGAWVIWDVVVKPTAFKESQRRGGARDVTRRAAVAAAKKRGR